MGKQEPFLQVAEDSTLHGISVAGGGRTTISAGDHDPHGSHPVRKVAWLSGRSLPEFQLLLVSDGVGEFESEATGRVELHGTALIFIFPGIWHRFRPNVDVGWSERWFSFHGELVHRLFNAIPFRPSMAVIVPKNAKRLIADFDQLLDMLDHRSTIHRAALTLQALRIISGALFERFESAGSYLRSEELPLSNSVEDPIVRTALELIWGHGHSRMSVQGIARQLPVTRRTLDRRFANAIGHSVLEEIDLCRLSRAKRLLAETDLPLKSVARLAGFSDAERMRVKFIDRERISPSGFRKRALDKRGNYP